MSQPNPTTPVEVDVAEGRRLLEAQRAATTARWRCERGEADGHLGDLLQAETRAIELLEMWCERNLPALLTAASERDAAVREVERLRAGLRELAEPPGPHADEIAWNMAERAEQILASAAQKQAKPALTIEDSSGGANE